MEQFNLFLKGYPVHSYNKGEVILQQYERCDVVYIVKSGIVKTYNLTANGEEKSIALSLNDEIFPTNNVFFSRQRTEYFYEALTSCSLYTVPSQDFARHLRDDQAILFQFTRQLAQQAVDYQMHINALEQSKATQKVLYTLFFLAHRFGKGIGLDSIKIQVPFTQQDMANYMGLARETTAIELKKLERMGVIAYGHRNYTIQITELRQLLGDDYTQYKSNFDSEVMMYRNYLATA